MIRNTFGLQLNHSQNLAVITGASSGIGEAYARKLAAESSFRLLLVARRLSRLERIKEELSNCDVEILECDLSELIEVERIAVYLGKRSAEIGILVNNAGSGRSGEFSSLAADEMRRNLNLNFLAPTLLSRAVIPGMKTHRAGAIINVCSSIAWYPSPFLATYSATKAGLLNLTLCLAAELTESGIQVLAHCPGGTNTEFHGKAGMTGKRPLLPRIDPAECVTGALQALRSGQTVFTNGLLTRLLANCLRLLPPRLAAELLATRARRNQSRLRKS